jgi:hypothetical protein
MESDWGKSVNMLISSTPFGELFTVGSRQETPKSGPLRLCLFKQNNITKESCLKQDKRAVGKEERRPGARV